MLLMAGVVQPVRSGEIDLFTRDLDLSGLQPPARNPEQRPEVNRDLFEAWDALPETLRTPDLGEEKAIEVLTLPAGPFLAVPNPASLPKAYALLNRALLEGDLRPLAPLIALLHTDGNVSIGCRVQSKASRPLPLGSDLSFMPELRLLVKVVSADAAQRTDPRLVSAAARLREHARQESLAVSSREHYLLPLEPGRIFLGLRLD